MKFSYLILLTGIFISCTASRDFSTPKEMLKGDIFISSVNIVDVENDRIINNQDVVIVGGKVKEIVPHNEKKSSV